MASLASINIRFAVDLKEFSTEMQNSLRTIDKVGQKFQAVGRSMTAYVTLPILAAGAAAAKFASDYNESLNKVDVSFKASSAEVKSFAKTTLETAGIAEGTALDMASAYGDMGTSMGLTTGQAAKMSTSLVGLAGDLASFKNISIDVANTAISAIFTGETESLKKLGIVMTEVNLKYFAVNSGIKKNYEQMSQAEKVQLRYNYILSVTKNAQGDFIRTQGGAANQSRIFTESLKQVGAQLGAVILPLVTAVLTKVNSWIKEFSKLSEGTKTTIVVIAGLAAAIGPLLLVIGAVMSAVPMMTLAFAALSANIVPIVAGLGLLLGAVIILKNAFATTAKASDDLNEAIAAGNKSAVSEVASLDSLYAAATNVKLSTEKRKAAIDQLQALYPAYFKNLDDETIKNGKAEVSYNQLRNAIFNKARAAAIDNELQKRANDRITKEIELQEKVNEARKSYIDIQKNAKDAEISTGTGTGATYFSSREQQIEAAALKLKLYKTELAQFTSESLKADETLLNAKSVYDAKSEKLNQNEIARQKAEADAAAAAVAAQNKVVAKKTESKGVKLAKPQLSTEVDFEAPILNIKYYEEQIARYKELQDQFATNTEEGRAKYQAYAEAISNTELIIQDIKGVDKLVESNDVVKTTIYDLSATISDAVTQLAVNAAVGFGEAIGAVIAGTQSLGGLLAGMLGIVASFMKDLGKQLVAIGIARIAFDKLKFSGVGAIAAGIALIALSTVISSKFESAPKFATGGIVGGSSYYGDKILARVNSGEMIANADQQKKIFGAMNSGAATMTIIPDVVLKGNDLYVSFQRTQKLKDRKG